MNNLYIKIAAVLILLSVASRGLAQNAEVKKGNDDDKIVITPSGRFYLDGATYLEDKTELSNGAGFTDARIGVNAKYQKWFFKIDMGYSERKVNPKDILLQYSFTKNSSIKVGHYAVASGVEGIESSAWQKFMSLSPATLAFGNGRQIGLSYRYSTDQIFFDVGAFVEGDAISNSKGGDDGYSLNGMLMYNTKANKGSVFQIGVVTELRTPNSNGYDKDGKENPRALSYVVGMPTKIDKRKPLSLAINDVHYHMKYALDVLASYDRFYTQNEFFLLNVDRKYGAKSFKGSGFYSHLGFLVLGDKNYDYHPGMKILKRPKAKSLELVLRTSYVDLDDSKVDIYGGRITELSGALNYYYNKYISFNLNYSHLWIGNRAKFAPGEEIDIIQGRVVFKF